MHHQVFTSIQTTIVIVNFPKLHWALKQQEYKINFKIYCTIMVRVHILVVVKVCFCCVRYLSVSS